MSSLGDKSRDSLIKSCGSSFDQLLSFHPLSLRIEGLGPSSPQLHPKGLTYPDGWFRCYGPGQWKLSRYSTMAPPSGAASYKKKDGILTLTADEQTLTWTPAAAGASAISIPVTTITSTHSSFHLPHAISRM